MKETFRRKVRRHWGMFKFLGLPRYWRYFQHGILLGIAYRCARRAERLEF